MEKSYNTKIYDPDKQELERLQASEIE